ncbi:hypothetical protein BOSE62_130806 [Bosea sp. 62]|nr:MULTISPECIES: DUF892 family protein [unclassified Bosea (in: a-proteobacteria)]CAD5256703.1 hypothetical protein BOSE7B_120833 [Bosea sp. 7B]CAD5273655.1 hypothetical protein BOSE21B_30079 [Bosea sp. 21B]CAD5284452.1 hypothetical protein BOSE46_50169 [Bosea sp. 46]VVT60182.1 hypothetical protein BOS5A_210973 [Bosea sp. EC-HK365B]VXB58207.1 hypothetical protein BOSE62_130806 [Bosea sp. 62]
MRIKPSPVLPWSNAGVAATTFGIAALIWLALVHLVAAGAGGNLAGRLRAKRVGLHTDEVAFCDTAHDFMTWAKQLGHKEAVALLDATLAEETRTDKLLTQLGEPANSAAVAKAA